MIDKSTTLTGKLLLAMPAMGDPRFFKAVIFVTSHDANGAMGLVINHSIMDMTLGNLLKQMKIEPAAGAPLDLPVLCGGPVESGRGFLLHTTEFTLPETVIVGDRYGLSGTIDALKIIADGKGPRDLVFVLGYAGWGAGQLEQEIQDNAWLIAEADPNLIFGTSLDDKWDRAYARLGVDPRRLASESGHA
jgi:putative transcriptional regulator